MINRKDEVTMQWVGQGGRNWRVLKCWVGNGYRDFTQCEVASGIWM